MVLQDHSSRPKVEKGPYFLQFGNQNLQVVHFQNLGFLSQILWFWILLEYFLHSQSRLKSPTNRKWKFSFWIQIWRLARVSKRQLTRELICQRAGQDALKTKTRSVSNKKSWNLGCFYSLFLLEIVLDIIAKSTIFKQINIANVLAAKLSKKFLVFITICSKIENSNWNVEQFRTYLWLPGKYFHKCKNFFLLPTFVLSGEKLISQKKLNWILISRDFLKNGDKF